MKCPHCLVEIKADFRQLYLDLDKEGSWGLELCKCPNEECNKIIIYLILGNEEAIEFPVRRIAASEIKKKILVNPKGIVRTPLPEEVPKEYAEDYKEAALILNDSTKASAALSRRCLQNILREVHEPKIKTGDLVDEIRQVIESKILPSDLANSLDMVREVGNFAVHLNKSKMTGEIIEVESGEAEWNLDVLEELFDFYFVRPKIRKDKKNLWNKKLKEAGRKELK